MELNIINFTKPVTGNVFADIILWLVGIVGVVGGVVLFTLLLKLVTFPFDYVSRASMRKNSVKMEEMRPELEKLQKQYAGNKELYNQKMMALYKKNGYSMFGACLPTIITLVIFIIALNGFQAYSQFQNKQYFYDMSVAYNSVVYEGFESDNTYIIEKDGKLIFNYDKIVEYDEIVEGGQAENKEIGDTGVYYTFVLEEKEDKTTGKLSVWTENGYVICKNTCNVNQDGTRDWNNMPNFYVNKKGLVNNEEIKIKITKNGVENEYGYADEEAETHLYEQYVASYKGEESNKLSKDAYLEQKYSIDFLQDMQQQRSADSYRSVEKSFLWVKNVWVADKSTDHPVHSTWQAFSQAYGQSENNIGEISYNNLTAKLATEKAEPNGFFILVILTAGSSLLMQIIMGKSQKAQMELQTVDGQGAQTQKMMKWMMPIMMAIFAFMYTAAFSIYIILSSVISMGTTFLINFIVDRKLKKGKSSKDNSQIRGRVYTPKQEEQQPQKKEKKNKFDKFAHEEGGDFLTGKADKKVRGRIK